jgi:hypothetical protein
MYWVERHLLGELDRALAAETWPIPDQARWDVAAWAAVQALRTTTQRQSGEELADILLKLQIGVGGKLCRAKTSLGVVSWPFTEVRLPCGIR